MMSEGGYDGRESGADGANGGGNQHRSNQTFVGEINQLVHILFHFIFLGWMAVFSQKISLQGQALQWLIKGQKKWGQ